VQGFTLSSGIGDIANIERFLDIECLSRNPAILSSHCNAIYSWGHKSYSKLSSRLAEHHNLPHIRLEDGFVCSFGRARLRKYSLVIDPVGIYYDVSAPSRLENILNDLDEVSSQLIDSAMVENAQQLMADCVEHSISKYNIASVSNDDFEYPEFALFVDQTVGDQSLAYGGMSAEDFHLMLDAAIAAHPDKKILVKVHPDVVAGSKQGHLLERVKELVDHSEGSSIEILTGDLSDKQLKNCVAAYVGTSLLGFELLMRNIPVICFGQPFYSGWGVTTDKQPVARRIKRRTITELFIASYMLYPTYIDPVTAQRCDLAEIIQHIAEQNRQLSRVGKNYEILGITPWKRRYVDRYVLATEFDHKYVSVSDLTTANDGEKPRNILAWGRSAPDSESESLLAAHQVARIEDGFVRSIGLGSDYIAPRSLVIDDLGIYFDPTKPSRLEVLLQQQDVSEVEQQRALEVMKLLRENRISKYSVSSETESKNALFPINQKRILVIGQVQGDASLMYGADEIKTNRQLLETARAENPDAYIVYKPHPDVVSGNRDDGMDFGVKSGVCKTINFCDHVETEVSIEVALEQCDEVHTITSLAGFEALLCGRKVVTYGKPFYAGWGLTEDRCGFERRTRKRTLAELVYISYILYPGYLDLGSGEFTSIEKTICALIKERDEYRGNINVTGIRKYVNIVRNIKKGLTYAA